MIIYDDNIWWPSMMIICDDHIWWSYMMIIYDDDHIYWSYILIIYEDHIEGPKVDMSNKSKNVKKCFFPELIGKLPYGFLHHRWCLGRGLEGLKKHFFFQKNNFDKKCPESPPEHFPTVRKFIALFSCWFMQFCLFQILYFFIFFLYTLSSYLIFLIQRVVDGDEICCLLASRVRENVQKVT